MMWVCLAVWRLRVRLPTFIVLASRHANCNNDKTFTCFKPCAPPPLDSHPNHFLPPFFIVIPFTYSNIIPHQINQSSTIIMCRGFVDNERENLKIKAFYTHLSAASRANSKSVSIPPDFLTLHFLPRISGGRLEINGSSIRPDSPAFLTLHRAVSEDAGRGFNYGSRERVTVCEGARFEIYVGDVKLLKGVFRKFDDGDDWNMECKCVLSAAVSGIGGAEVAVEAEGLAKVMKQKVEMVAALRRRRGRRCCELEEIPEVREEEEAGSGACCCSECGGEESGGYGEMEMDVEAVNWAVDVGIWVVCLGVGYMVSASSFKKLRRKRFI